MQTNQIFPVVMAFFANFLLGISSIYWHLFKTIPPVLLVAYRVAFSFIILLLLVLFFKELMRNLIAINWHKIFIHFFAAILVAVNWGVFIWASIDGKTFESGLGYLIAPVVVMLISLINMSFAESWGKVISIIIIATSLAVLVIFSKNLSHWIYWVIGITWGIYAFLKKITSLLPVTGLFLETITLLCIILLVSFFIEIKTDRSLIVILNNNPWLYLCGIVSVVPLVMFSYSARRLGLYSMGALQFVLPTTQLVVSVLYYNQNISSITYICFFIIWITLLITTFLDIKKTRV